MSKPVAMFFMTLYGAPVLVGIAAVLSWLDPPLVPGTAAGMLAACGWMYVVLRWLPPFRGRDIR